MFSITKRAREKKSTPCDPYTKTIPSGRPPRDPDTPDTPDKTAAAKINREEHSAASQVLCPSIPPKSPLVCTQDPRAALPTQLTSSSLLTPPPAAPASRPASCCPPPRGPARVPPSQRMETNVTALILSTYQAGEQQSLATKVVNDKWR